MVIASDIVFCCPSGSQCLRCYEIYKEMILEVTKHRVITVRILVILDVIKVAYELSGPFAQIEAPQADNSSSTSPENFNKNVFFAETFV